jgi:hypothetical protein
MQRGLSYRSLTALRRKLCLGRWLALRFPAFNHIHFIMQALSACALSQAFSLSGLNAQKALPIAGSAF